MERVSHRKTPDDAPGVHSFPSTESALPLFSKILSYAPRGAVTYREVPDDARPITAGADALAVVSPDLDRVDRALVLLHGRYQRLALLANPPYSHLHDRKNSSIGQDPPTLQFKALPAPCHALKVPLWLYTSFTWALVRSYKRTGYGGET
jgi:hypothetical protein